MSPMMALFSFQGMQCKALPFFEPATQIELLTKARLLVPSMDLEVVPFVDSFFTFVRGIDQIDSS